MLEQLAELFPELTKSQKKLAAYITDNSDEILLHNSFDLARKVGVSEATVSRFVRRLGFSSYLEFKKSLIRTTLDGYSTIKRLAESSDAIENRELIAQNVHASDIENIQKIRSDNTDATFEKVVGKICSARTIYILGLRSSYALAYYLSFNLRFFLKNVVRIEPGVGDLPEQLVHAGPADLLFVISFKRYTQESVVIARRLKAMGLSVVSLVDSKLSPVAALANASLIAGTGIPSYFESYTAAMSLLNGLIAAVVLHKEEQAIPALERLEKVFEEFQTFHPI